MRLARILAAAAVLAAWPSWAAAQCGNQGLPNPDPWDARAPFVRLMLLEGSDCLGGSQDSTAIAVSVREALKVKQVDGDPFRAAVDAALGLVSAYAGGLNTGPGKEVLTELAQQVGVAQGLLGTGQSPALAAAWEIDNGRIFAISRHLQGSLDAACRLPAAPECPVQFEVVKDVLRSARLIRRALDAFTTPTLEAHRKETARRALMWEGYFAQTRSQYPWELLVNGARMKDTRQLQDGVRFGFREVPRSQVMFLHADVAFEYASAEVEGNRFSGVVVVDVVGYNRWKWKADGSIGMAVGGSFVVAMGDHANMKDVSVGFMLHLASRWSAGMTFSDDRHTVLVSGDVAQLWTKVSDLKKKKLSTGQ